MGRSAGDLYVRGWSCGKKSYESAGDLCCAIIRSEAANRARVMCAAMRSGRKKATSLTLLLEEWSRM